MAVNVSKISIYTCLLIIFVIPLTVGQAADDAQVGNLYYWTRLVLFPLAIIALMTVKRNKALYIEYSLLAIVALLAYLAYGEIPTTCALLLAAMIVFDSIDRDSIRQITSSKYFRIALLLFLIQIIFSTYQSYIGGQNFAVLTSAQDRNYSAFFILLMYFLIPSQPKGRLFCAKDILLILAVLTFSRTGMLAVLVIVVYKAIFRERSSTVLAFVSRNAASIFALVFIAWMVVCVIFCSVFNLNNYVYEYRAGFERFSFEGLFDYSNYIRAFANVAAISNAGPVELFLGFSDDTWKAIVDFEGKAIFPHNLLLAIFVKGGILYSLAVARRVVSIFKDSEGAVGLFAMFLIFCNFLGPSLYYGVDLLLILLASTSLTARARDANPDGCQKSPLFVDNRTRRRARMSEHYAVS